MTTLSFHSVELLLIAFAARNRAYVDFQRPNALTSDSITAIVLSAAASEAFVHELADHIEVWGRNASRWAPDAISPPLAAYAAAMSELEESHAPVTLKYLVAALALSGHAFVRDRAPFQDFADLIRLRNALMHMKPASSDDPHQGRRITEALAQRGIAIKVEPTTQFPWLNRLEVPAVAEWACTTSRAMILAVLDLIPPGNDFADPVASLATQFRTHLGFNPQAR